MRSPGGLGAVAVAFLALLLAIPVLPVSSGAVHATPTVHTLLISGSNSSTVPIDHVVVVMMENHVYDNFFGTYCLAAGTYCSTNATGLPAGTCIPYYPNDPDRGCAQPFLFTPANATAPMDLNHTWASAHTAYDNGSLDGFYLAESKKLATFGHFDGSMIPTYWDLAEQYGVGDNFFGSVLSYSTPNHWFLLAGQSPQAGINVSLLRSVPGRLTSSDEQYLNQANSTRSIADVLINSTVSWKYYDWALSATSYGKAITGSATAGASGSAFDYWNPLAAKSESYSATMASHFVANSQFFTDAANNQLPNVSWLIPQFNQSDHPPAPLANGENFIASVVNTVEHSAEWNRTVIFVSWDDYGGDYDHVAPPAIDANGVSFRVPLLVIGPYVRENYVDHHFEYFESILHFIEWRFHLSSVTARDANAPLPLEYFDFNATPRPPMTLLTASSMKYPEPLQSLGAPPAPQNLAATGGPGTITLNWTIPAGGTAIGQYLLSYGPASNPGQYALRVDGSVHSVTVSNLPGGVLYQFSLASLTGNSASVTVGAAAIAGASSYYQTPPNNATAAWESLPSVGSEGPSARQGAVFVSDLADGLDLLFGGVNANGTYLSDSWEWLGGRWTQLHGTAPSARAYASAAYDTTDKYVVLYGGTTAKGVLADTWKFLGGTWTNLTATSGSPPKRDLAAMANDQTDSVVLLFGGKGAAGTLSDTWRFNKGKWTQVTGSTHPSPRWGAAMGYDALDNEVVLFGGASSAGATLNDTWTFAAKTWKQVSTYNTPSARYGASVTYDGRDQYLLLLGGYTSSGYASGAWEFSYGLWHALPSTGLPPLREYGSIAYDTLHQAVLLGFGLGSSGQLADLWSYVPPLTVSAFASPTYALAPALVTFSPSVVGGFLPYQYSWNFADGSATSSLAFTGHTFSLPGSYLVSLKVTDAAGISSTIVVPVEVTGALTAVMSASAPTSQGSVTFSATCGGGWAPYSYLWSFGDGNQSEALPPVVHQYGTIGNWTATVVVTDASGAVTRASLNVTVATRSSASPISVAASANVTGGRAPLAVSFSARVTNASGPFTVSWNFGDGSPIANGTNVSWVYKTAGNFTATVTANDSSHSATASITISVTAPLNFTRPAARPDGAMADDFGATVTGGRAPYVWIWQFGDGGRSSSSAPTHAFAVPGTYTVSLTVVDSNGLRATQATVVTVEASPSEEARVLSAAGLSAGEITAAPIPTAAPTPGVVSPLAARWTRDEEIELPSAPRPSGLPFRP